MKHRTARARLKKRISGNVDSGFEYPNQGSNSFIDRPTNIRNEMLNPTDSKNLLRRLISFSLSTYRIKSPGIVVRHKKPRTCLKTGISANMLISVTKTIIIKVMSHLPNFIFLPYNNLTMSY